MNPLKHKLANEWMRQDDASPQEALDTWNTMEAEFKLNRAALQEPRTMAQGGRIGLKPGGLVEPGVGYYANKKGDPLPKEVKDFLIETFDDVEFDWGKGRYGFTKKDDTALYTKINEVVKKKLANPNYIFKPDLGSLKYEKGFGTGKQLLEKARSKGINAKEGRAASIFADNFNIKSQRNPLGGQIDKIYDLTALDNPKNIETIIKAQVQRGAATPEATEKYLSQDIKKDKKRKTQAKRKAAIKERSVFHYETEKWAGNKRVHLSHMDDIYSQYMTGQTLGYAPKKINKTFLDTYDHKLRALYKKRERLLKEKPKDLVKQLEQINIKGARLAGETGGYKSFKFLDPYTLKPYQFGVDSFKTIDPFNLLKGKKLKDIIIKGDPFNPKSKLIFDRSQISAEDEYFFEENRKRVLKTQSEVNPTKTIKNLKENQFLDLTSKSMQADLSPRSIAQLAKTHGCGDFKVGGSIMQCLQGKFKESPEKFLQKSAPLAKDNVNLRKWFKNGRKIARGTGIALAWEAAFAPIIGGWAALEGESGARIINEIAYGIPFIGETTKEEWMREAGGDEKAELAYKMQQMGELEEQELPYLQQQRNDVINKMSNVEGKSFHQRTIEDDIKEKNLELQELYNTPEFYEGPAGGQSPEGDYGYNEPVIRGAFDLEQQTTAKIAADKADRKKAAFDWLEENKIYANQNWQSQVQGRAEGGIMNLKKKW